MKNKNIFFVFLLFSPGVIFSQNSFEFEFNFPKPSNTQSLIDVQIFDFNNDGEENVMVSFITDTGWSLNVFSKNGSEIYEFSDELNADYNIKRTFIYKSENEFFVLGVFSQKIDYSYYDKHNCYMKVVSLNTQQAISEMIFSPSGDIGDNYDFSVIDIYHLSDIEIDVFAIGFETTYSGHGPGVDYYGSDSDLSLIYLDGDSLYLKKNYDNIYKLIIPGNFGYGFNSSSSSVPRSSSKNTYIYSAEFDTVSLELNFIELINDDENDYLMLSTDDSSNSEFGVTFYNTGNNQFFSFSEGTDDLLWENSNTGISMSEFYMSSNIQINGSWRYTILFMKNYQYYKNFIIQDRVTGLPVFEGELGIAPIRVVDNLNSDKYILSFWGSTYTFYSFNGAMVNVEDEELSNGFNLFQNFPNPFNPATTIEFEIPREADVEIEIYNLLGEKITTVFNKRVKSGKHEINFNARNLPSGIYIYRLRTNNYVFARKMALLK